MTTKIRPFLKWAGNKYNCLEHILPSLPKASRLIEPFAGSCSVFLNSNYPQYILAEENNDLIGLFTHLKNEGENFTKYCAPLFVPENNTHEKYYAFRTLFNETVSSRKRAALFLYLNKHGYNGLCRYNHQGGYNVPFGRHKNPYFPEKEMIFFHQKAKHVTFLHSDFTKTFELAKKGDVIYCDPPYSPINQESNFSSYVKKKFTEQDHKVLAELAIESMKKGITVVISNHHTEFTEGLYELAKIKHFQVMRTISCKIEDRVPVNELLAIFKPES